MRRLGLPMQPSRRTAAGTSRPWPLAVVVTNDVAAPRDHDCGALIFLFTRGRFHLFLGA